MENGEISDNQIIASSSWNYQSRGSIGRLNLIAAGSSRAGSWVSWKNDLNQWLQVDFQRSTIITGISTQGRQDLNQFVKSYTISFSDDRTNFNGFRAGEILKVAESLNFVHAGGFATFMRKPRIHFVLPVKYFLLVFRNSMETVTRILLFITKFHLLLPHDSSGFILQTGMGVSPWGWNFMVALIDVSWLKYFLIN